MFFFYYLRPSAIGMEEGLKSLFFFLFRTSFVWLSNLYFKCPNGFNKNSTKKAWILLSQRIANKKVKYHEHQIGQRGQIFLHPRLPEPGGKEPSWEGGRGVRRWLNEKVKAEIGNSRTCGLRHFMKWLHFTSFHFGCKLGYPNSFQVTSNELKWIQIIF